MSHKLVDKLVVERTETNWIRIPTGQGEGSMLSILHESEKPDMCVICVTNNRATISIDDLNSALNHLISMREMKRILRNTKMLED